MKKMFICLLSIIMLISTLPFVTAAASGTPISTADEFMAMSPTGEYYLAADITLKSTYRKTFEGRLDGNGKTLTISAPIFEDFSGKVEDLTIEGKVIATDEDASAFALTSSKGFEAINCTNNAKVTVMGYAKYVSGFVGTCEGAAVKFTNCVNNGAIYLDSTADEKQCVGGFGSIIDTVIMNGCTNNGNVYLKGSRGIAGGFVARVAMNAGDNCLEIYNSTNNGNITVEDTYIAADGTQSTGAADAGGIVGNVGVKGNSGVYKIWGCTNNGDIDGQYRTGGLVGYCYASQSSAFIDMQFCINTGNVTYGRTKKSDENKDKKYYDYASSFVAYTNSAFTTIKYCIDTGNITKREGAITAFDFNIFVGSSSADTSMYDVNAVYMIHKDQYKYFSYTDHNLAASYANTYLFEPYEGVIHTSPEDITSGKVAHEINLAAKNDPFYSSAFDEGFAFYQKIGEDALPSVDQNRGLVVLSGDTYVNGESVTEKTQPEATKCCQGDVILVTTQIPETTPPPSVTTSPETEPPVQSGCGGFSCYAILIVIVCTSCLWKKWTVVSGQWTERCE
ncbi:MAG: hypothetical protein IJB43_01070 [Clostridia bacterium]|nr:hypothetical protein [Clostridia bacterium]